MKRYFSTLIFYVVCVSVGVATVEQVPFNHTWGPNGANIQGFVEVATQGTNSYVLRVVINSATNTGGTPAHRWDIYARQTHTAAPGGNFTALASPVTIVSSSDGTGTIDKIIFSEWFSSTAYRDTPARRTGKFEAVIRVYVSGGSSTLHTYEWVTTADLINNPGEFNPGGGSTPGGGNSPDPEVQRGFWSDLFSDLFVPSQDAIDCVVDAASALASWGPLGIPSDLISEMSSSENQVGFEWQASAALLYTDAELGIIGAAPESQTVFYMPSGFRDWIAVFRALLGALLWFVALYYSYKVARAVMVSA